MKTKLYTIMYNILFGIFALGYFPILLFKSKVNINHLERLGIMKPKPNGLVKPIWIHAVSVGEAGLALKLAKKLKEDSPEVKIVISTTTSNGQNVIAHNAKSSGIDHFIYFPLDISFIVKKVINFIDPSLFITIETEIWPILLRTLKKRSVPVVLVNGRISDNSYKNYKAMKFFIKGVLSDISRFCMQTDIDKERILDMGAQKENVFVSGNIKFDESALVSSSQENISRVALGIEKDDLVIVCGSTHYPEEHMLIDLYSDMVKEHSNLKMIIVPRHIERSSAIKLYAEKLNIQTLKFSELNDHRQDEGKAQIIVIDALGLLKQIYSFSDIAFIGGTFMKKGGQNPIEAAVAGKPIIFGSNMSNFREISDILVTNNGALQVDTQEELFSQMKKLLLDEKMRIEIGQNAIDTVKRNTGALSKTTELINECKKRI